MPPVISRHESPFGSWTSARWRPSSLRAAVDAIWYFDGSTTYPRERVLPNGVLELVLSLDGPRFIVEHDGRAHDCPTLNVSGLQLRPMVVISPVERVRVLGIRLRPAAAFAVIGRALPDLAFTTADLRDVVGESAIELAERCHASASPECCVRAAADWITSRLASATRVDPAIEWILRRLDESHGAAPIAELREQSGLSRNRLASTFNAQVGIAPKRYARIRRFDRALRLLHERARPLALLALECGYYDQAHMTSEFAALADRSPASLAAAVRYPDSLNLAER